MDGSFIGETDKDITIYLVDKDGNKDKMLMDNTKYKTVSEYLCSDEYRKSFTVNNVLSEYKTLIIEYGETTQEVELNYDRANGTIEYYALKNE